jgi:ring-1,2-phenylacetyl-CoA epoxidase subunit PaaB
VYGNVLTIGPGAGEEQQVATPAPATHAPSEGAIADGQWQLWEVFTQEEQGAPHEHAGSVRATDPAHALQNARDVYGRRGKVISMWVVPTGAVAATSPSEAGPYFDPMNERPYVHPHFYKAPRGVRGV